MLTFPVDKELSTHVYLEPVPFLPENPPGRPVTTLSETEKTRLGDAVGLVSAILLEIDPLNIGNYDNEYDPEACAIISMLKNKGSENGVAPVIVDVFKQYFDTDISGDLTGTIWRSGLSCIWNIIKTHDQA